MSLLCFSLNDLLLLLFFLNVYLTRNDVYEKTRKQTDLKHIFFIFPSNFVFVVVVVARVSDCVIMRSMAELQQQQQQNGIR